LSSFERNGLVGRILFSVAHYSTFLLDRDRISSPPVCAPCQGLDASGKADHDIPDMFKCMTERHVLLWHKPI